MRYIKKKKEIRLNLFFLLRAEDGTRTRDPNLGKVMLYQLSYFRNFRFFVKEMRLELTRHNCHYPLKVARLPIPPLLHFLSSSRSAGAQNRTRTCTLLLTLVPETSASTIPPPGLAVRSHRLTQLLCLPLRAEDGTRTRDPNLGKVMLYQLSYFRVFLKCDAKVRGLF